MDVRKYRTLHRHTYLACNSHYQIFLSCLQSTLSDDPSYMWFIPPNSPLCLQFILTTLPSYLQFTPRNNPSILAVHTIEYSIKLTATLSMSHHTYNSHFEYSYHPCNSHYRTSHHAHSHTIEYAVMIYSSHNRTIHHPCTSHYRIPNHADNSHHQIIHHACNYTIEYTIMNNEFFIEIRSTASYTIDIRISPTKMPRFSVGIRNCRILHL